ncbi:MAG: hypothetical protein JST78_00015 [Bacteroidetes bacterium]|nr:hypothetical protein [Bacteroidota bacterium]
MIRLIQNSISKHLSLFIIVIGAASFFLSNIVLKDVFTEEQYGQYSIVITYFSMIFIYGMLGTEQIFLRYSNQISTNQIETQKFQTGLIIKIIIVTSLISTVFFKLYFGSQFKINTVLLYFSSISMISMLYLFNIFRLNSEFVFAQFISNFWRLFLLLLSVAFLYLKMHNLDTMLNIVMLGIIVIFVCSLGVFFKKIQLVYNTMFLPNEIIKTAIQFFISITTFSLLTFGDRFVIQNKFGFEEFGNYFYLTNFFLAPFSILQNYIGFKQLIFFKQNFTLDAFNSFNKKVILFGLALAVFLYLVPITLVHFKLLRFDFNNYTMTILLLLILGIVRLYSSSITSAFEAKTNVNSLQKANMLFISISFLIIVSVLVFLKSLDLIVVSVILIWFIRTIIYKQVLVKQILNEKIS